MPEPLHTIDVGHPARPADEVERVLDDALALVRSSPSLRVLKIIHGYGRSGRGGSTKEVILNWAHRRRSHLRAVIPGERYGLFDPVTQQLRREAGPFPDRDLDRANPGVTLLWVK
jgi:hypothetical protein